jgi:hypothetical protein
VSVAARLWCRLRRVRINSPDFAIVRINVAFGRPIVGARRIRRSANAGLNVGARSRFVAANVDGALRKRWNRDDREAHKSYQVFVHSHSPVARRALYARRKNLLSVKFRTFPIYNV